MDINERFWVKVEKTDSCWEWTAARTSDGYGLFRISKERRTVAHRFAYEATIGPIPTGMQLDHLCRNRACVNPAHLEPVTQAENIRRGIGPGANRNGDTCRSGLHSWPESARDDGAGGRFCYECKLISNRRNGADFRRRKRLAEAGGITASRYQPMRQIDR